MLCLVSSPMVAVTITLILQHGKPRQHQLCIVFLTPKLYNSQINSFGAG